ncbi:outer membrane protein assembly factor BamB [Thioalkalivibrio sp. ALJ24]|uniref:outer membrane protein assembly factor BamB n=1 Tax=Thioalkalivibrio sp. ALJ24 TaxID=545276 RepID=UPI00037ABC81|nr:outer membrane protein assembly factor BamB [Thioalkalivibrio sp. ALJ24]
MHHLLQLRPVLRLFAVAGLAMSVSACGLFSRDETEPPAELVDFDVRGEPSERWSASLGRGGERFLWEVYPAVTEDRVFAAGADGRVMAFDRDSGSREWRTQLDDVRIASGVAVGDGVAVVGTLEGMAIAVSDDGEGERWRTRLSSEVIAISEVASGVVIARTNDGRLHALDIATGAVQWTALRTTPALSLRGGHVPQIVGGRVLAGFDDGRLMMLGINRGNTLWETTLGIPAGRSEVERMVDVDGHIPIYRGAALGVSYQGRMAAVDLNSGEMYWDREFSSYQGGDVSIGRDRLVVSDAESHVHGIDPRSGADQWENSGLRLRSVTAPVIHDDFAIVGDFEGYLHWLDLEDGDFAARTRVARGAVVARPVLEDDTLYVITDNGRLTAVDVRIGADGDD